jgi:hypothetical protein
MAPPATTNATVNKVKRFLDAGFQWVDVGGTYTVGFENGAVSLKPSFTVMGKPGLGGTWVDIFGTTFGADWEAGPIMSYVPAWDEYDVGVGVSLSLFRLPPKLTQAQADTPIIDTVTPKASIVKAFGGVEIRLNNVTNEQIERLVFGVVVPL